MANSWYDSGLEGILDGTIDVLADDIRIALVTGGYTRNVATDTYLSTVGGGNIVARSAAFTSKTATGGVFDAADITISAVSGSVVTQAVIYKYNASDSAARLIISIDTATGLPLTPNGGDVPVTWSNGSTKIGKL